MGILLRKSGTPDWRWGGGGGGVWAIAYQGQALTPPPRPLRSHPSPQGGGKQRLLFQMVAVPSTVMAGLVPAISIL